MAPKALVTVAVLLPVLVSLSLPFVLPIAQTMGFHKRELSELNNQQCTKIESLRSCEDTWLDQESGYLYAACGNSPEDRMTWFPCNDHWDVLSRSGRDYLAVLDTASGIDGRSNTARTKVLQLKGFHGLNGEGSLTVHGMGTWKDPHSNMLRLFIVNHRPPVDALTGAIQVEAATKQGANSTIEIFETELGSDTARHIRTVAHPLIMTPNDVDGIGPDSFYVTNDHHVKKGHSKILDMIFPLTNVVHCDEHSCKEALKGIKFANGIHKGARDPKTGEQEWYLSATASDKFYILSEESDHTLSIKDTVKLPYPTDNLYVPSNSISTNAYITIFPKLTSLFAHFKSPRTHGSHAGVMRISKNTDQNAFFGEKYKVEKVYEDDNVDPESPSGITGVAIDEIRSKLYLASLYQPYMWTCNYYQQPQRVKFD
ncbi:unnamed protein product [Sympodiomycopsis kandeliae]